MEIVAYREKYRDAFVALNTEWLERFTRSSLMTAI